MRAFKYEDSGHTMDGAVVYQYIMGSGHIETCGHTETHLPSTHSKITVVQSRRTPPTRHFFLGLFMSFAFPFRTFFHSVVLQSGKLELLPPRKKTTRSARKKHTRRCERKRRIYKRRLSARFSYPISSEPVQTIMISSGFFSRTHLQLEHFDRSIHR